MEMLQIPARFGGRCGALWAAPFLMKHKEFKGFWSFGASVFAAFPDTFLVLPDAPFWTPEFFRARFARPEIQAKEHH